MVDWFGFCFEENSSWDHAIALYFENVIHFHKKTKHSFGIKLSVILNENRLVSLLKDYVPFLRVFGLNGKKSRSSEIKNRHIAFFKGSTNMNELKKKSCGRAFKKHKKTSCFFEFFANFDTKNF